jgi:hypothetical protein
MLPPELQTAQLTVTQPAPELPFCIGLARTECTAVVEHLAAGIRLHDMSLLKVALTLTLSRGEREPKERLFNSSLSLWERVGVRAKKA